MKRTIILILVGAILGGGVVWTLKHGGDELPDEKSPEADANKTSVTHEADGHVVISISTETQKDAGIVVASAMSVRSAPELKAYGRVPDPAPLAAIITDLATAEAASAVSSNELTRLKTLAAQDNASPRALQTAEAAARRDQLAVQSAKDRLALSWGRTVAVKADLPGFIQSLTSLQSVLVRIDVPSSDILESLPTSARVVTLTGKSMDAEFLDLAPGVDPQFQGRGFIFLMATNALHLLAGEAVTGYLKMPGEPLAGVAIPRQAVVRTDGKGWVYVLSAKAGSFARKEIALDHPTDTGWFVTNGVTADDRVVVTGAQTLLSEELKSSISAD